METSGKVHSAQYTVHSTQVGVLGFFDRRDGDVRHQTIRRQTKAEALRAIFIKIIAERRYRFPLPDPGSKLPAISRLTQKAEQSSDV